MSTQGNAWKSSCKQTITAKALAGAETRHATQTGSCPRPPKSPKNSKWKRQMVSDEDSDSSNESLHEHQHTSKKKKNASFKHSWKEKSTTVEIKEVCNIENVMDSEVEVINCKSDAKSGEETENDDGEDAVSEVRCKNDSFQVVRRLPLTITLVLVLNTLNNYRCSNPHGARLLLTLLKQTQVLSRKFC
jgi:hypothetical protein